MSILRTSILIIFLSIGFTGLAQIEDDSRTMVQSLQEKVDLNWVPSFYDALKTAKWERKPVMLYFTGSDWCAPCIKLDKELFYTQRFKNFADENLVIVEVDIPRRKDILSKRKLKENLYLQKKYKVKSFPTLLFVNHRGKKFAEKKGYVLTEYYFPYIQSVVDEY